MADILVDAESEIVGGVDDQADVASRLSEEREQQEEVQATDVAEDGPADSTIPSKFEGKSVDEIVNSYVNLEQQYGRQGNELGELRKLADSLIQKNLNESDGQQVDSMEKDLSQDEFFSDPVTAVRRVVNEALEPVRATLSDTKVDSTVQRLQTKHPDIQEIVQDLGFQEWV